eukprot:3941078-Rhodomonas_salina.3
MSGTDIGTAVVGTVRHLVSKVKPAILLRASYAMSGTDLANVATGLRQRYAMSGTDLAYGATRTHGT